MTRHWIAAAFAALATVPGPAGAQEPTRPPEPPRAFTYTMTSRPRIGVSVDMRADAEKDKFGARILGVTPDGPAEKAGLREGDIITRFNGTALAGSAGGGEASGPGQRLVELAGKLEPGDTVKVEYRRESTNRSATLVAEDLGFRVWTRGPEEMRELRDLPRMYGPSFEDMGRHFRFTMGGGAGHLELADMNAGLGQYFGTSEGALVLDTPADSTIPLRAGDVILSLDGRAPKSSEHARRILGSYEGGETVKAEVMRQKKRISVSWTAPKDEDVRWRVGEGAPMRRMKVQPAPVPKVKVERSSAQF
jgi:C-terminal processing protease CtpA/Prc